MDASRAFLVGLAAALALGAVLAARPAEPAAADPPGEALRLRRMHDRAHDASLRLAAFAAALGRARDEARRGAALVQVGDRPPAPALHDAAALAEAAIPAAEAAEAALAPLRGFVAAMRPGLAIPAVATRGDLLGIAGQLRDAADAAGAFVKRRQAAAATLEELDAALAALDADDPRGALDALATARSHRAVLAAWEPAPVTLPLWLRTTQRLIAAAEGIAHAGIDEDPAGARRAARRYAAAVEDARRADVSLALTLSEAGNGLTATPMRRLAAALAGVETARGSVASLMLVRPGG